MIDVMQNMGERCITIVDGGTGLGVSNFSENGYRKMLMEIIQEGQTFRNTREWRGARLKWATKYRFYDYREDELTWIKVPNGIVHKEFPLVTPFYKPGTSLIHNPTMKTHNLGIMTLTCKGMQGIIADGFKHFCHDLDSFDVFQNEQKKIYQMGERIYYKELLSYFHSDFREKVIESSKKHIGLGLPYWTQQTDSNGVARFELFTQRISDIVSCFQPYENNIMMCISEGIIGRDGTAFNQGNDIPAGLVIAGINPVHTDAVTGYLMGHDPRYVPYLIVANERNLGENDMEKIPVYLLPEKRRISIDELNKIVVPQPVYLHGDGKNPICFNEVFFDRKGIKYNKLDSKSLKYKGMGKYVEKIV